MSTFCSCLAQLFLLIFGEVRFDLYFSTRFLVELAMYTPCRVYHHRAPTIISLFVGTVDHPLSSFIIIVEIIIIRHVELHGGKRPSSPRRGYWLLFHEDRLRRRWPSAGRVQQHYGCGAMVGSSRGASSFQFQLCEGSQTRLCHAVHQQQQQQ